MDKEDFSKGLRKIMQGPIDVEKNLKYRLASSMWQDANDFLWRFSIVTKNLPYQTKSILGKSYVDLVMSMESSLKSLIITLSPSTETPEDSYIVARTNGYNLNKLYMDVEKRAVKKGKLLSKKDRQVLFKAATLTVSHRYSLVNLLLLLQEHYIDREFGMGSVSSVINPSFLEELYNTALKLSKISDSAKNRIFRTQKKGMSGTQGQLVQERQKTFYSNLSSKKKL